MQRPAAEHGDLNIFSRLAAWRLLVKMDKS